MIFLTILHLCYLPMMLPDLYLGLITIDCFIEEVEECESLPPIKRVLVFRGGKLG